MRKTWLLISLAAVIWLAPRLVFAQAGKTGYPQMCSDSATNPTSAEWLTCTQARAGTTAGNPIYTTSAGGAAGSNAYVYDGSAWVQWRANTLSDAINTTLKMPGTSSFNYYFNGTTWDRARGGTLTDNLTQPAGFPYNASFLMVWDGSKWDRMTQPTGGTSGNSGDAISATQSGLYGVSLNHFYNGTNFKRWLGETVDDDMTAAPVAPWVAAYGVYRNMDGGPIGSQRFTGEGWDGTMSSTPTNLNVNAFGVYYSNTSNRGVMWVGESAGDTIGAAGPTVLNIGHFYNGTGYQRWKGEAWDADMATTTNPNVNSFNVYKDAGTGGKNRQLAGDDWDTTIDNVTNGPGVISLNAFYSATTSKGYQWNGTTLADNMAAAPVAPFTISLGTFYNGTNNQRWTGPAAGADTISNSTPAPWTNTFLYGFNGATWDRLYVLGTQADAQATTVNGLVTSSFLYGYNGSTFDMLRIGASNELQVTDVAVRPGENASLNVVDTQKKYSGSFTPAKTTTAAIADGAGTTVLAAVQIINYPNCTITAKNTHGSIHWTDFIVYTGPTASGPWGSVASTDCDALVDGASAVCWSVHGHSANYVYAVAVAASASSSSDVYLTCNAN